MATTFALAFENTNVDVQVSLDKLEGMLEAGETINSVPLDEQQGLHRLAYKTERLFQMYNKLMEQTNEFGRMRSVVGSGE